MPIVPDSYTIRRQSIVKKAAVKELTKPQLPQLQITQYGENHLWEKEQELNLGHNPEPSTTNTRVEPHSNKHS